MNHRQQAIMIAIANQESKHWDVYSGHMIIPTNLFRIRFGPPIPTSPFVFYTCNIIMDSGGFQKESCVMNNA